MNILKYRRHAGRLAEVAKVLGKYGLADWLSGLDYEWVQRLTPDGEAWQRDATRERRIRLALVDLGPTFIKLGQVLSTRPDLVGPALAVELSRLQVDTRPDPPEVVRATVLRELGASPDVLFDEFDEHAFASASIGQVHYARTGDRAVVVKVQHADIEDTIAKDLEILGGLAALAEEHAPQLRPYRPRETTAEFRRVLLGELDYTRERRNLEEFARNFAGDENVHLPGVDAELSSRRVLTMERIDGVAVAEVERLRAEGCDLDAFARRGVDMYLEMVFRDGFYHADPHPGNLLYLTGGRVGVLDCGMVGRLDEELREQLDEILIAIGSKDSRRLAEQIVQLGRVPVGFDRNRLRADVSDFVAEYGAQSIESFDLTGALTRLIEIVREHHIVLPSSCTMLLKTLIVLEGTARMLSPSFSLGEVLEPYQSQILRRRWAPQRLLRRARQTARDWDRLVEMLPASLTDVMARVQDGRFDVHVDHRRLDSIANRLVLGVLCAALFIASAMLWALQAPPLVFGVSLFGVLGYAMAVVLAWRLLWSVARSDRISRSMD